MCIRRFLPGDYVVGLFPRGFIQKLGLGLAEFVSLALVFGFW